MTHTTVGSTLETRRTERIANVAEFSYRPEFYRLWASADQAGLEALLGQQPVLQVFDEIQGQLAELLKARRPDHKYRPDELQAAIEHHLAGRPRAHYGVWVYYPWAARLVHLLDEAEFVELRTDRNRHKITRDEQARLARQRVGIVGLSVGQAIALTLALERGCGELRLADFDRLELSNLNRLRTGVHTLGVPKVIAAAREIAEIDPYLAVTCYPEGVTEATVDTFLTADGGLDLVLDECDSLDVKVLLRQRARAHRNPVVMCTSDRGLLDVERFDREPSRPLFHGLAGDLDYPALQGLTTEEKVPYILQIMGLATTSARLKASFIEVEQTIATWPQLGSAVVLGGAVAADVCRRIALGQYQDSGRYFVDLETLVADRAPGADPPPMLPVGPPSISGVEMSGLIQTVLTPAPHGCLCLAPEQITVLVEAGIRAPSGGNSQPWLWAAATGHLFLFHDERRSAASLDQGLGGLVALGAAIENVVLQAHALGLEVLLHYFPAPQDRRLVAGFCFAPPQEQETNPPYESHDYDALVDAVSRRRTNRALGPRQPLDPVVLPAMAEAVATIPGARLHYLLAEDDLEAIGELIGAGDRVRLLHPQWQQEMMAELRWTPAEAARTRDGVDLATLPLAAVDRAGLEMARDRAALTLLRAWDAGERLKTMSRKAVAAASAVGLITMRTDRPLDYLLGGRAMQRAWLIATQHHLAFQPLSILPYMFKQAQRGLDPLLPPALQTELYALRLQYQALFSVWDGMGEILLFRLAVADPPPVRERRRPVEEVLRCFPRNGR